MSDITKKIHSLEQDFDTKPQPVSNGLIRSIGPAPKTPSSKRPLKLSPQIAQPSAGHASDIPSLRGSRQPETFPDFITRDDFIPKPDPSHSATSETSNTKTANAKTKTVKPASVKPAPAKPSRQNTAYTAEPPKTAWIMWTGLTLTFIWIGVSAAVYFGLFKTSVSALAPMALSGLILAVLLPAVLITLLWLTWKRLANMSHEAGRLAHAAHILTRADETALINTRNLAVGIQSEMSIVDEQLGKMLDRFEGLKNDIAAHGQEINTVGLTLTERSDDVGRSLTLQRQALESVTSSFDTRMETLGSTIETQSAKLTEVTDVAAKNIETAEQSLERAAQTLSASGQELTKTSEDTSAAIEGSVQSLSSNHEQLSRLNEKVTQLIGALTKQQEVVKADLAAQSENLQDMSNMAKGSTDTLQENLKLGSDLLAEMNAANQGTQTALKQHFTDIENMISGTQERADAAGEAANTRVQNTLSQTRKDLSKLEVNMQTLSAQLSNAREQQLDLAIPASPNPQHAGFGRLQLKPLETDFPPVVPPRIPARDTSFRSQQAPLDLGPQFEDDYKDSDDAFSAPINLGADMEIANPDKELTDFDPDVLRPVGKGFGITRNTKEKAKSGWRWRDMLGGLEQPDSAAPIAQQAAPLAQPPLGAQIISRLSVAKLSPSAVVDNGTIIEAAKARVKSGPATMLSIVDTRLSSPVAHLRQTFTQDAEFKNIAKSFVTQYGQSLAYNSVHDKALRESLGTSEGRAYLLCAAALS